MSHYIQSTCQESNAETLKQFLLNNDHITRTVSIFSIVDISQNTMKLEVKLSPHYDYYYNDFFLSMNTSQTAVDINNFIKLIQIDISGECVDKMINIKNQMNLMSKMIGTKNLSSNGENIFIPLLGPLSDKTLFNWRGKKFNITIEFSDFVSKNINLYATEYLFKNNVNLPSNQTYCFSETEIKTVTKNNKVITLPFISKSKLLYLIGLKKTEITNLKLYFDGNEFINLPIEILEYKTELSDLIMIKFSNSFKDMYIDFSKMDRIALAFECSNNLESQNLIIGSLGFKDFI